jgi:hypothetical protein
MSGHNFYHGKGATIVAGSANFAAKLVADAVSLGITPAQATAFGVVNTALQSAWTAAVTPETRTSAAIELKNDAIKRMRAAAIPLAKQIIGNGAVSDSELILLGLLPRTSPGPIPPTMDPPVVYKLDCKGRLVSGRIKQAGLETAARPIGSVGAYVFSHVGETAPTDPNAYKLEGLCTRRNFQVLFPNDVPTGATAWIAAAWVAQRQGQRGFACTPVSVTIQGGPILAETA